MLALVLFNASVFQAETFVENACVYVTNPPTVVGTGSAVAEAYQLDPFIWTAKRDTT